MNDPQKSGFHVFTIRYPYVVFEQRPWQPFLNICETDNAIVVIAELAGVDPNSIQVDVEPNRVHIRGIRRIALPPNIQRIDRMEIASGPFQIDLPLDRPIDPERTASRYHHGLLEVVLPMVYRPARRVVINVTEMEQTDDYER